MKRIRTLLGELKNQFAGKISDIHQEWEGNGGKFSFLVMGFSVSGTLMVHPSDVEISGDLPLAAAFFKGRIESTIRDRTETLLA